MPRDRDARFPSATDNLVPRICEIESAVRWNARSLANSETGVTDLSAPRM
jgi:hypothetical protein